MIYRINRSQAAKALAVTAKVVPTRTPKQILENVLINFDYQNAFIQATDLDIGIVARVDYAEGLKVDETAQVVLPAKWLDQILAGMDDEVVEIEIKETMIIVATISTEASYERADPAEFPTIPLIEDETFTVKETDLSKAIRFAEVSMAAENTRYALNSICLELNDQDIATVATNGRSLSCYVLPITKSKPKAKANAEAARQLLPPKAASVMRSMSLDPELIWRVALSDSAIQFECDRYRIYTLAVSGRFPQWREVVPKKTPARANVKLLSHRFLAACKQMLPAVTPESSGVDLAIGDNKVSFSTRGNGLIKTSIPASYDGEPAEVSVSVGDMIKLLSQFPRESELDIEFTVQGGKNAIVIKASDQMMALSMPLVAK